MKLVRENIKFERNQDPKKAMGIGFSEIFPLKCWPNIINWEEETQECNVFYRFSGWDDEKRVKQSIKYLAKHQDDTLEGPLLDCLEKYNLEIISKPMRIEEDYEDGEEGYRVFFKIKYIE